MIKTYKVTVWEHVKIWALVDIVIEAESIDDAMEQMIGNNIKLIDCTSVEYNTETEEHLDWDFGYVKADDIEEVNND